MKVTIGNHNEVELKYSVRSMIMYENITEKSFSPQSMTDIITYFYCVILSSGKDYSLTFDEFIDYLDENPDAIKEFSEWLNNTVQTNSQLKKK